MTLIGLTGVPGCGKTTVANALKEQGHCVIDIHRVVVDNNFILGIDEERDSKEMDLDKLSEHLQSNVRNKFSSDGSRCFLDSHLSHLLPVDHVIVLRCHPDVLKLRMEARGWSEAKVRENLEAEAMAIITQEALEAGLDTYEIDVTDIKVESILTIIDDILDNGMGEQYRPGAIDHFEEILKWY